jgi:hypothetical protein
MNAKEGEKEKQNGIVVIGVELRGYNVAIHTALRGTMMVFIKKM